MRRRVPLEHRHPELAPLIGRLRSVTRPVAGPPAPSPEQLLLVPHDPAEGQKPASARRGAHRGRSRSR